MNLVVYGAGGMGRELIWQISSENMDEYNLLGFIDDSTELENKVVNDFKVLGNINWLLECNEKIAVAIALGDGNKRRAVVNKLKVNKNITFPNIISKDVIISPFVEMGEGNIICYRSLITVNVQIGDFLICNRSCNIGHDVSIGDYVTLNPCATLSGGVKIADYANIGASACIIQNKTIGKSTVIGAGAVVTTDIPGDCTAVGVPAKPIKFN